MVKDAHLINNKEELIKKIYETKFTYEPESKIVYSDIGFILLGFIVEKIMKMPIDVAADKYIFNPLNMKSTSYKPDKKLAAPTEYREDYIYKGLIRGKVHDERAYLLNGLTVRSCRCFLHCL